MDSAPPQTPAAEPEAPPPLSKPPRLLHFVEAETPPSLAQGQRGERAERADVILTIDVDEQGHVTDVAVAQSAGPELDRAAVAAARQFTFEPGEAGGKPVPVRITYTLPLRAEAAARAGRPPPVERRSAPVADRAARGMRVAQGRSRAASPGVTVTAGEARVRGDRGRRALHLRRAPGRHAHPAAARPDDRAADTPITLTPGKRLELTIYADAKERYTSVVRGRRALVETVEQTL